MDITIASHDARQAIARHQRPDKTSSACADRLLASLLHLAYTPAEMSELLTIVPDDDPAIVAVFVGEVPSPLYRGPVSLALVEAVAQRLAPGLQVVIVPHDAPAGEEAAA